MHIGWQSKREYPTDVTVTHPPIEGERHYPDWISEYVKLFDQGETPTIFHKWSAIMAVSEALGRKCHFGKKSGDEGLFPNFYVIITGDSRAGKSYATDQMITAILMPTKYESAMQRLIRDTSLEDLYKRLGAMGSSHGVGSQCLIHWDEMSRVFNRPDAVTNFLAGLCTLWDCKAKDTRSRKSDKDMDVLHRIFVNLLATSTLSFLSSALTENVDDQGGFLARTIFVNGFAKHGIRVPDIPRIDINAPAIVKLREDWMMMNSLEGEFVFDEAADDWYRDYYINDPDKPVSPRLEKFHTNVLRVQIKKLAMVISASRRNTKVITKEDVIEAKDLLLDTYADTEHIYKWLGARSKPAKLKLKIEEYLRSVKGQWVDQVTLFDIVGGDCDGKLFLAVLDDITTYSDKVRVEEVVSTVERSGKFAKGRLVRRFQFIDN